MNPMTLKLASLTLLIAFCSASCRKTPNCNNYTPMEVIKDCTGTYLRAHNQDTGVPAEEYKVCNDRSLKKYNSGETINACFQKLDGCNCNEGRIVCEMLHEHDGFIDVGDIK